MGVHQEANEARGIVEAVWHLRAKELGELLRQCRMVKTARLCVLWAEEFGLPWAAAAREAAAGKWGTGRWMKPMKNGRVLVLKP